MGQNYSNPNKVQNISETILIMNRSDFKGYYGDELLANLEGISQINFGSTINFVTKTMFKGTMHSPTMDAFNAYLRQLSRTVSRIIIN